MKRDKLNLKLQIPFDPNGNQLEHATDPYYIQIDGFLTVRNEIVKRNNYIFHAKLQCTQLGGRVRLKCTEYEYTYSMSLNEFEKVLLDPKQPIYPGCIFEADWSFTKKGEMYMLVRVED